MWIGFRYLAIVALLSACASPWLKFEEVPLSYRVQGGDTLHQIAFRYRLDPAALAQWNGIGRDARIIAGAELRLRPPLPGQLHPVHGGAVVAGTRRSDTPSSSPVRHQQPKPAAPPLQKPVGAKTPTGTASKPVRLKPSGSWPWPLGGTVVRGFGKGSDGIDIAAPEGSAVRAVAPGTVVYGGSALKGYGLLVIVQHRGDVMTAYAHSSELLVGEGETIRAGQIIARSGMGPGNKAMLHFEVRSKGQPVDPMRWLGPIPAQ